LQCRQLADVGGRSTSSLIGCAHLRLACPRHGPWRRSTT
jgi:hypothetical protein